ncbi:hypothetical protein FSP39_005906 [Pinctada imbricata]|uniref:Uncharacterized protein n=1 Tax=Pinctada imbricata TaxID=66713 RepID=A0AA89BNR0_PINIB|nr:hypothetical protein FSP39_005906 [Pinctada imbricata]
MPLCRGIILQTVAFYIFYGLYMCQCQENYNNSVSLYRYLFNEERYVPNIIPVCNKGENVSISIDIALRELVELNEKFQLLRLKIWVRLQWTDCSLTWSPDDFGGQDRIIVPYGTVWMPDLAMYEGCSDEANMPDMREYRANVMSDGSVRYNFPTIVTAACRIDVTYFPYDYQNCSLTFSSWMYSGALVDIQALSSDGDTDNFIPHNEWKLISLKSDKKVSYYSCCPEPYPKVIYYLVLARYPKFYLLTLFFPCIIVSLLSLLGFMLPPVSGEKISLQITILLTIVVFLLLVQDKLPSSSDTFPYIGIYFSISMILVCLSCVMSGVVMYVYFKGSTKEKVSPWIRRVFLTGLRRMLCVSESPRLYQGEKEYDQVILHDIKPLHDRTQQKTTPTPPYPHHEVIGNGMRVTVSCNDIPHYKEGDSDSLQGQTKNLITNDWELLAYVLDRLFLLSYIAFTTANISSFFILMGNKISSE